jgi:DNA-binding NarL/FixJ family response regulator
MDHSYRNNMHDDNDNGRRPSGRYQEQGAEALATTNNGSKSIYCFVDDLFFLAKIQETARKLNVKVEFVKGEKDVIDGILALDEKPSLIIFDLNSNSSKPLTLIPKLKSKLKKDTNFIGFLSHLQGDLKIKATEAGCDMVIPRSAFSQNLPQILRRHAVDDQQDEQDAAGM